MSAAPKDLPELLAVAFEAGGIDAVVGLAKAFGGKRMHIPKTVRDGHPILVAAGDKAGRAVVQAFAGCLVQFPKGKKAITRLVVESMPDASTNALADALGVTYRHAGRLKKQAPATVAAPKRPRNYDPRQLDIEEFAKR